MLFKLLLTLADLCLGLGQIDVSGAAHLVTGEKQSSLKTPLRNSDNLYAGHGFVSASIPHPSLC